MDARWRVIYTGPMMGDKGPPRMTGAMLRSDAVRFAAHVRKMGGTARVVRMRRGRV